MKFEPWIVALLVSLILFVLFTGLTAAGGGFG
jgi:hypothetical protein